MDPEEFKKKYGLDLFAAPQPKAPMPLPAQQVVPGDVRQLFPGNVPGAPAPPPPSGPAARPVSPFLTGTDPAAQEAQAAFFEKFGFPMFAGVPQQLLPQQPESLGRQIPGATMKVTGPTALPTPEVRPAEGEMPWLAPGGVQADVPPPPTPWEEGTQAFRWLKGLDERLPGLASPSVAGLPGDLWQGLKGLDIFDTGLATGAAPQQAWASPMAVAESGLFSEGKEDVPFFRHLPTGAGEERWDQTREAAIGASPLGRWLDGRYGDVRSGDTFNEMIGDLTQMVEEQPIGYSLAFGLASPTNLIPIPLLDPLIGTLFRGVWKGVRLLPKTKRTLSWVINGEWPTAKVEADDASRLSQTIGDLAGPPVDPDLPFFHYAEFSPDGRIAGFHTVTDTPETRAIYEQYQADGLGRIATDSNETGVEILEKGGYARKIREAVENERLGRVSDDATPDDIPTRETIDEIERAVAAEDAEFEATVGAPRISESDRFLRPGELHPHMDPEAPTGSRVQQYVRGDGWHDPFAPRIPEAPARYTRFFPQEGWVPGHTNHPYLMHFIDDFLVDIGDPNLNVDIDNPWVLDKLRTYADWWENWSMRRETGQKPYRLDLPANYYALEKNVAESLRKAVDGPVEQRRTWLEDVRDRIHKYSLEKNAEMRERYSPHWRKGAPGTKQWVAKWQKRLDEVKSSFDRASDSHKSDTSSVTRARNFVKNLAKEAPETEGLEELRTLVDDYDNRPIRKPSHSDNLRRWVGIRDAVNNVKLPELATDMIDEGGVLVGTYSRFFQPPMVQPIVIPREAAIAAGREIHETTGSLPSQLGDTPSLWAEAAPVPEPVAAAPTPVAEAAPAPAAAPAPRVRIAEEPAAPVTGERYVRNPSIVDGDTLKVLDDSHPSLISVEKSDGKRLNLRKEAVESYGGWQEVSPPTAAAPTAAPAPRVRIAEQPAAPDAGAPPKALIDSKPGYRGIKEVTFDDFIDKALFIIASRTELSKRDPVFLRWVMDVTGLEEDQVLREAARVREDMKQFYVEGSDEMNVPELFDEVRAGELALEEAFGPVLGQSRVSARSTKFQADAAAARKTGGGEGFRAKQSLIRKEAHDRLYDAEDALGRPLTRPELDELEESVVLDAGENLATWQERPHPWILEDTGTSLYNPRKRFPYRDLEEAAPAVRVIEPTAPTPVNDVTPTAQPRDVGPVTGAMELRSQLPSEVPAQEYLRRLSQPLTYDPVAGRYSIDGFELHDGVVLTEGSGEYYLVKNGDPFKPRDTVELQRIDQTEIYPDADTQDLQDMFGTRRGGLFTASLDPSKPNYMELYPAGGVPFPEASDYVPAFHNARARRTIARGALEQLREQLKDAERTYSDAVRNKRGKKRIDELEGERSRLQAQVRDAEARFQQADQEVTLLTRSTDAVVFRSPEGYVDDVQLTLDEALQSFDETFPDMPGIVDEMTPEMRRDWADAVHKRPQKEDSRYLVEEEGYERVELEGGEIIPMADAEIAVRMSDGAGEVHHFRVVKVPEVKGKWRIELRKPGSEWESAMWGNHSSKRKANERLAREVNGWNRRGDKEIEVFHPDAQKEFDALVESQDAAAAARKAEQEAAVIASRNRDDRVDAIQSSMKDVSFKNQDIEVPILRAGERAEDAATAGSALGSPRPVKQVKARVYKGLAIHRMLGREDLWVVTHIRSGNTVYSAGFSKIGDARVYVKRMTDIMEWDVPEGVVKADPNFDNAVLASSKMRSEGVYADLSEFLPETRKLEDLARLSEPDAIDWPTGEEGGGSGTARPEGGWGAASDEVDEQLRGEIPTNPRNMAGADMNAAPGDEPPTIGGSSAEAARNPGNDGMVHLSMGEDLNLDEVNSEELNRVVRWIMTRTPASLANPSAAINTDAGRLFVAYRTAQVKDDEYIRIVLAAFYDSHAKRWSGKMDFDIDDEGFWKKSGVQWTDVWEHHNGKYSHLVTDRERRIIVEYINVIDEIENLREYWGLGKRRRGRLNEEGFVPRKAVRWRDADGRFQEFSKPSSSRFARLTETATEMYMEHGIRYETNPRAVMELHLRQAWKEIRLKQFEDKIEELGLSINITQLMDPQLVTRRAGAFGEWTRTKRSLRAKIRELNGEELQTRLGKMMADINIELRFDAPISREQIAMRAERAGIRSSLASEIAELKEAELAARYKYFAVRGEYKKQMDKLRAGPEYVNLQGDGVHLFGGMNKEGRWAIKPNLFRNKFFIVDDAGYIEKAIGRTDPEVDDVFKKAGGKLITTFNTVGNTSRFLASFGDFALPFYQLLPLLFRNPEAWARATANHYMAYADPTVQARLIRDNIDDYWLLANNGVPVGDPEFFAALVPGQGISVDRVIQDFRNGIKPDSLLKQKMYDMVRASQKRGRAFGQQTVGRFQASYQTGLGYSRVQLLRAIRRGWRGTDNEMYSYIRNMTGGLDSRRLGIGPNQRGVESMWLAFSPRLLRSTLALSMDAMRGVIGVAGGDILGVTGKSTAQQRESFRSIASLIGGVFGIYVATGFAMGKDWEEIQAGMNPLNGRRFLAHNVNGDWIGVGGQIRALMQLTWSLYGVLSEEKGKWQDIYSTNLMKNPFGMFYMSRGAPGLNIGGALAEGLLPGEQDVLPFDEIDGIADVGKHIGFSSMPFSLQHFIESKSWQGALWEFFGGRSSANPLDRAVNYLTNGEDTVYGDSYPMIRMMAKEMTPTGSNDYDDIETERRVAYLMLGNQADISYIDVMKLDARYGGQRALVAKGKEFPPPKLDDPDPVIRGMAQFYNLMDHRAVRTEGGFLARDSHDNFEKLLAALKYAPADQEVLPGLFGFGWTPEVERQVLANTNLRPVPWFVLEKVGGAYRDGIFASQNAREQILIEMGRPELAALSRRIMFMYRPDDPRYADMMGPLLEEGPPGFGTHRMESIYTTAEEEIQSSQGALIGAGAR